MPFHRVARCLQLPAGRFSEDRQYHRVLCSVREEYRGRLIGGIALGRKPAREKLVAREPHDAGEALRVTRAAGECHGTSLREPREYDAFGGNAAGILATDQLGDLCL